MLKRGSRDGTVYLNNNWMHFGGDVMSGSDRCGSGVRVTEQCTSEIIWMHLGGDVMNGNVMSCDGYSL